MSSTLRWLIPSCVCVTKVQVEPGTLFEGKQIRRVAGGDWRRLGKNMEEHRRGRNLSIQVE